MIDNRKHEEAKQVDQPPAPDEAIAPRDDEQAREEKPSENQPS